MILIAFLATFHRNAWLETNVAAFENHHVRAIDVRGLVVGVSKKAGCLIPNTELMLT